MTDDRKKRFDKAAQDNNLNLGGLFGSLGEALTDMVARLEDGKAGAFQREHVIETAKGPIHAQTGIRVRVGGLDRAPGKTAPQPINPDRAGPVTQQVVKDLVYDLFEDEQGWILTADLPGVARKDIALTADGATLTITTAGSRRYHADIRFETEFDLDAIRIGLRNGILDLSIPRGAK